MARRNFPHFVSLSPRHLIILAIAFAAPSFAAPPAAPTASVATAPAAAPGTLTIKADQPGHKISPTLYGMMTEEINFSYDGGLYAEMIRNRIFQDNPPPPVRNRAQMAREPVPTELPPSPAPDQPTSWSVVADGSSKAAMILDKEAAINKTALVASLRVDVSAADTAHRAGVANEGYWGMAVRPNTTYRVSFYAKSAIKMGGMNPENGPLTVDLESSDGKTIHASAVLPAITPEWTKYSVTLKTGNLTPSQNNRFVISAATPGTFWLNLVSCFQPTFNDRPNGLRIDTMQKLADLHPSFLRFPGGNYVQGEVIDNRFDWKKTVGPLEDRPGHMGTWYYRSSDGLGLLEYLEWCEDLKMQPVVAAFGGFALRGQRVVGDELKPYVQDALDEIEYITGDASTKWGGARARDGHPAPFVLNYMEIGNEDGFDTRPTDDGQRGTYEQRFAQFYDAIKAKYPNVQIISTVAGVKSRKPDVIDDHYYWNPPFKADMNPHRYDKTDRDGPKIMVGEWASRESNVLTASLNSALSDAAWMTGMERNSDVVILACYAPLFINMQQRPYGSSMSARTMTNWSTDLIGYDNLNIFGSVSYYAQKMFYQNRGDVVIPVELAGTPTVPGRGANADPIASMYVSASKENASGDIIVKVVNILPTAQSMQVSVPGLKTLAKDATGWVLSGGLTDVNSLAEPKKVVPKEITVPTPGPEFMEEFPGNSVTVLRLKPGA